MNEQELIEYMQSVNCSLFKTTRYNTLVFRNSTSGKKASISREAFYVPITICGLCKSLRVDSPDHLKDHVGILDAIIKHSETIPPPGFANNPIAQA